MNVNENFEAFEKWFAGKQTTVPYSLHSDLEILILEDMSRFGITGQEWNNPKTLYNYWRTVLGDEE